MPLQRDQQAPLFSTEDIAGNPISLKDYTGKKILLSFFRYAGCPFCNLTMSQIIARYENFQKRDLVILAFFQSPKESVLEYIDSRQHPPFPLIADPDKKIYDLYNVQSSVAGAAQSILKIPTFIDATVNHKFAQGKIDGDPFLMPAQFLIGPPETTIKQAYYGTDFADKIPFVDIEEFILTDNVT